jgi:hypothetical protein
MPMRITRVTDRILKSSATLRVATVAFLWLPISAFLGLLLMKAARYFLGVPHAQGLLYAFVPGFLAMEAFLLRMDWRSILVCDADDGPSDMMGYDHLSQDELAAALRHPRNVWGRRFALFSTAWIHGFFGAAALIVILGSLHDFSGRQLAGAGLATFFVYAAAFALIFDYSLQGQQKFRWRRNSSKPFRA